MSASSSIEWTDATWNPTTGCSRVSKGCDLCYAMTMARRFDGLGTGYDGTTRRTKRGTDWTGTVHLHKDRLSEPLSWRKSRLVFVDSMSDLFHPKVPFSFIDKVFAVMGLAEGHIFQVLTKRPERVSDYLSVGCKRLLKRWNHAALQFTDNADLENYPLPNVWLGTSVEDENVTDRITHIRDVDAKVRFLSLEPLLGPLPNLNLAGIDWVIVGGESGHGARPIKEEWVIEIREQCVNASVPFFFKQWGGRHSKEGGRELEGKVWSEMPSQADLVTA